jgi:hypothetical protein
MSELNLICTTHSYERIKFNSHTGSVHTTIEAQTRHIAISDISINMFCESRQTSLYIDHESKSALVQALLIMYSFKYGYFDDDEKGRQKERMSV